MFKKILLLAAVVMGIGVFAELVIGGKNGSSGQVKTDIDKKMELQSKIFPVIKTLKQNAKNPDSVKVEKFGISSDNTVCIFYRATNSFNAIVPGVAYERKNEVRTDDAGFKKYCNTPMVEYSSVFPRQP